MSQRVEGLLEVVIRCIELRHTLIVLVAVFLGDIVCVKNVSTHSVLTLKL